MLSRGGASTSALDDPAVADAVIRERHANGVRVGEIGDLRSFWMVLRWRARLIAAVALATLIVGAGALVVLPPK
jgi:uncharacterized protein involved in exopolysaccharide biosynthesis